MLYNIFIHFYYFFIWIASFFNDKAKKWINGRKSLFNTLVDEAISGKYIWFHCSSLGEFEQGRPVIEMIKKKNKAYKILITFFSPSGYEIRKNYEFADLVTYLPLDTPKMTRRFIELVNPQMVFFVKYDFWYNIIKCLKEKNIKVFLISGLFNKDQLFFKKYAGWYRNILRFFDHLFVQDETSKKLLQTIGINNVTVAGDNRFDRAYEIPDKAARIPLIEKFSEGKHIVIGGSTWEKDEKLLVKYINEFKNEKVKYIIAPHEISQSHIKSILETLEPDAVKYSEADHENIKNKKVLVIDNIGMLSALYRYASIAYIGGGFGKSIHNIMEPATFGLPVLFGPNHHKFREANDLIERGAAVVIKKYYDLKMTLNHFLKDQKELIKAGGNASEYIKEKTGASGIIYENTLKSSS